MAVTPKEKKQLQAMWDRAGVGGGGDIPDGTYQFEVKSARFHMTEKGKPTFKTKIKVVGGDEEIVGKETEVNDNLETEENQGWFKKKLQRLNIPCPEDFEEVTDGTVADLMVGKVFEGQVKTKNDFMNVYVNRLVGESEDSHAKSAHKEVEEEQAEEPAKDESSIEEGASVTWGNGKEGTVLEVLADDNQARVKKKDGSTVRVALNLLKAADAAEADGDEEESGAVEVPDPDAVEGMKSAEVKKALKDLNFDAEDISDPRSVLHAFCTLAHDPKAKIELSEVSPLANALDVTVKKGAPFKDAVKALSAAVQERLG